MPVPIRHVKRIDKGYNMLLLILLAAEKPLLQKPFRLAITVQ